MTLSKIRERFLSALCVVFLIVSKSHAEGLVDITGMQRGERERVLLFDIAPVSRCMFGDYDLLLNDLQNARGGLTLKLTVESVGDAEPTVWEGEPLRDKTDEKNVGTYRVALPLPGKSRVIGVFLCSVGMDQDQGVPCSQQSLSSFNDNFLPYQVDSGGLGKKDYQSRPYRDPRVVKPKLYYAQFLAVTNSKVAGFTLAPSREHAAALKLFGVSGAVLNDVISETQRFSETLSSLPLQSKEGRLQIPLPFFDSKRCNGAE